MDTKIKWSIPVALFIVVLVFEKTTYDDIVKLIIFNISLIYVLVGSMRKIIFIRKSSICRGVIISYEKDKEEVDGSSFNLTIEINENENTAKRIDIKKRAFRKPVVGDSIDVLVLDGKYESREFDSVTTSILGIIVSFVLLIIIWGWFLHNRFGLVPPLW